MISPYTGAVDALPAKWRRAYEKRREENIIKFKLPEASAVSEAPDVHRARDVPRNNQEGGAGKADGDVPRREVAEGTNRLTSEGVSVIELVTDGDLKDLELRAELAPKSLLFLSVKVGVVLSIAWELRMLRDEVQRLRRCTEVD